MHGLRGVVVAPARGRSGQLKVGVVGGGIIGLAAAEALSRGGAEVSVFERGRPGVGQSGGLTRIFRHLHGTDEQSALAVEARHAWRALERRCGRVLLGTEGVLINGGDLDAALGRLVGAGVRAELVEAREVARLLPILGRAATPGIIDRDGGAIRVRRALRCLEDLLPGGSVTQQEVFGVRATRGGPVIDASEGSQRFSRVLIAAGAQTSDFAAGVGIELSERRGVHPRLTFDVRAGTGGLACYLDRSATFGESVYAGPVGSSSRYVVGLSARELVRLGDRASTLSGPDGFGELVARTVSYVRQAMPGLDPSPVGFRLCHVTALASGSDAFGAWERDGITVFAGHNVMKFAPLIGERLARGMLRGGVVRDLERFKT